MPFFDESQYLAASRKLFPKGECLVYEKNNRCGEFTYKQIMYCRANKRNLLEDVKGFKFYRTCSTPKCVAAAHQSFDKKLAAPKAAPVKKPAPIITTPILNAPIITVPKLKPKRVKSAITMDSCWKTITRNSIIQGACMLWRHIPSKREIQYPWIDKKYYTPDVIGYLYHHQPVNFTLYGDHMMAKSCGNEYCVAGNHQEYMPIFDAMMRRLRLYDRYADTLSDEDVKYIYNNKHIPVADRARQYNVSHFCIGLIDFDHIRPDLFTTPDILKERIENEVFYNIPQNSKIDWSVEMAESIYETMKDMCEFKPAPYDHIEFPCHIWTDVLINGYGVLMYQDAIISTHRIACIVGAKHIPRGAIVRHRCDVKACCNPQHLKFGNESDNVLDLILRGNATRYGDDLLKKVYTTLQDNSTEVLAIEHECTVDRINWLRDYIEKRGIKSFPPISSIPWPVDEEDGGDPMKGATFPADECVNSDYDDPTKDVYVYDEEPVSDNHVDDADDPRYIINKFIRDV